MSVSFFRGENPLRADKLNQAFSERVSRGGDQMVGPLILWRNPQITMEAATKQYVDAATGIGAGGIAGVASFNTRTGAVTLTNADVTTAIGYTPYNVTNPAGYITAAQAVGISPVQSVATRVGDVVLAHTDITDWVVALAPYATLASPIFTGDPRAPTPSVGDNDTSIATTAFVAAAIAAGGGSSGGGASVTVGDTAPVSPANGDLWFDSVTAQLYVRYSDPNGSQWVIATNATTGGGVPGNLLIDGGNF